MYVFGYGSLMDPRSASRTLPGLALDRCVPARLADHARTFDVAFPNDASQPDKHYLAANGRRPHFVLFANLRHRPGAPPVNGVLIPIDGTGLEQLRRRERRYLAQPVSVEPYPGWDVAGPVRAFVGQPQFCRPQAVASGLVPADYWDSICRAAAIWEQRCPGFAEDFAASTDAPAPERIVAMRRIDSPG